MTNPILYKLATHTVLRDGEIFDTKQQIVRGLEHTAVNILRHIEEEPKSLSEIESATGYPPEDIIDFLNAAVSFAVVETHDPS